MRSEPAAHAASSATAPRLIPRCRVGTVDAEQRYLRRQPEDRAGALASPLTGRVYMWCTHTGLLFILNPRASSA
eukprot:scaffold3331_cov318-Prasinococcus_capsulatus_cf.AAC.3